MLWNTRIRIDNVARKRKPDSAVVPVHTRLLGGSCRWLSVMLVTVAGMLAGCTPVRSGTYAARATATAPTASQPAGLSAVRVPVSVPARADTANVLLYVPEEHEPGHLLPTVLYLHGASHRGNDLGKLRGYGPPRLLAEGMELPFILVAPQLPEGEIWSDADFLITLVDELRTRVPIDPDRLYVTGMSMGGRGAWYLAYRYPDRFAAVVPVATFQPINYWASSGRLRSVPVRAYHGDQDPLAPFDEAAQMHDALGAAGGQSTLRVLQGRDHFIADVYEDPELYEWLLSHRRTKAVPR